MLHPVLNRRQDVGGAPSITTRMSCRWRTKSHYWLKPPKLGSGGECPQPHGGCQGVWAEAHPLTKGGVRKTTLFIKNEESLNRYCWCKKKFESYWIVTL